VKFWDTSALAPAFVAEPSSRQVKRWLRDDPAVVVWMFTRVELAATIARRRSERPEMAVNWERSLREIAESSATWTEIAEAEAVRRKAEDVLQRHLLRAADALQIGAALIAADGDRSAVEFVTFDRRLAAAAAREDFAILGG
jgi:predicted nucleic acid-binding protein